MYGLNRYICNVLDEMRKLSKSAMPKQSNYEVMLSLIEEAQVMANRMEAALGDLYDLEQLHQNIKDKEEELKDLEKQVKKASKK